MGHIISDKDLMIHVLNNLKDTKQGKKKKRMRVQHLLCQESLKADVINVDTGVISQHNNLRKITPLNRLTIKINIKIDEWEAVWFEATEISTEGIIIIYIGIIEKWTTSIWNKIKLRKKMWRKKKITMVYH